MLLQLKDIAISIGVLEILNNISFIIEEKEKAALIGVNGAGKTSVFRIIMGMWKADNGEISIKQFTKIGYLPQLAEADLESDESLTLYENLDKVFFSFKEMEKDIRELEKQMAKEEKSIMERYSRLVQEFEQAGGYETASRVRGVLKGLGFSEDKWNQKFSSLSGGQKTRAMLGKRLLEKPDLLLLDEPTNHLDIESVQWLEDYLKNFPGAVLIISHDRYFLDRVVSKTIEIEHKKSKVYNGNYTYYVNKKASDRDILFKQFTEQRKIIQHHEEVIKTLKSFKTEAAMIRARSREKLLAKIERIEPPDKLPTNIRIRLNPKISSGNDVLSVEGLTMGFGNNTLFSNINFSLQKGDRAAVIGPNGIGKTTLFKVLVKDLNPWAGTIKEGINVRLGYYDQSQQRLSENKTIFSEIADTYPKLTQTEIRTMLGAFVFIGDDVYKPISALSGGERGRVALAKIMLAGANFLILDEPTNHLDLYSKEILEQALIEFPGTVLFISHDRYFVNRTATLILELSENGLKYYHGNYDYYQEKKLQEDEEEQTEEIVEKTISYKQKKENESAIRRYKSRVAKIEYNINILEDEILELDTRLLDDEIGRDINLASELYEKRKLKEEELNNLYKEFDTMEKPFGVM